MRQSNVTAQNSRAQTVSPPNAKNTFRGHLDLLDPVTWASGPQGFISGAIASGVCQFDLKTTWLVFLGLVLVGPLSIGFSQSINDYFDRDVDALNEPTRPIPAGLVTLKGAFYNFMIVGFLAVVFSLLLATTGGKNGIVIIAMTVAGLILATCYSMPPFEFKRNGFAGPLSVGIGYNLITWMVGLLIFTDFKPEVLIVALVNAFFATGIIILNDLKSIEGDRALGLRTLPVMFGAHGALKISFFFIDASQAAFAIYLFATGHFVIGALQVVTLLVQMYAQKALYAEPTHEQYKKYLLTGNGFVTLVALLSALSFGNYIPFNAW